MVTTAVVGKVQEREFEVERGVDVTIEMALSILQPKEGTTGCSDDDFTEEPMPLDGVRFFMQLRTTLSSDGDVLATLDSDADDETIEITDSDAGEFELWLSREITVDISSPAHYSLMMITGTGDESRADCILKGIFQFIDNPTVIPE